MMNTPAKFPKANLEARHTARAMFDMLKLSSPPTEQAVVASVDTHVTAGYVMATTYHGPIRVFGIKPNTVIPGMKIFVRKMTHAGMNDYIVDATHAGASGGGILSYSLGVTTALEPVAASSEVTTPGNVSNTGSLMAVPTGGPTNGWFLSFFFYLSDLPSVSSPVVLADLAQVNVSFAVTNGFRVIYDYQGHIGCYWYTTGSSPTVGTMTTVAYAPHSVWHLTLQVGNGHMVDGKTLGGSLSNLSSGSTFAGGNYGVFLLGDSNGQNSPAPGSWISKAVFGCNYNGSAIWPYAAGFIPGSDSDIVNGNATLGSGLTVYGRWLCSDYVSGPTIPDSADVATPTPLTINGLLMNYGPY